jgi:putative ABC transport system substrate-binding protein
LSGASATEYGPFLAAFRQGLGEQGYVEGKNVVIEFRWAEGRAERLPALADELVKQQVTVIAAAGGPAAALAAKAATATIPIVFLSGSDPIAQGLVTNLNRPQGNLTGLTFFAAELAPKRLQLLRELIGRPATIAVLENPNGADTAPAVEEVRSAAAALDQLLLPLQASSRDDLDRAFATIAQRDIHAVLILADPFFVNSRERLQALSERGNVAAICPGTAYATFCAISYGPKLAALYQGLGRYVGKVLAGKKPAELPVQRATKLELVINLKMAKTLGLTVPQLLLAQSDEVIE